MSESTCVRCDIKLENENKVILSSNLIICPNCSYELDKELMVEELQRKEDMNNFDFNSGFHKY